MMRTNDGRSRTSAPGPTPAMNRAIDAMVLKRLDGRRGQWVTVDDLAAHLHVGAALVRARIESIYAANGLVVHRIAGVLHAALAPEGRPPCA